MNPQLNALVAKDRIAELTRAAERDRRAPRVGGVVGHRHWRLVAVVRLGLRRRETRSGLQEPPRVAQINALGLTARRDG